MLTQNSLAASARDGGRTVGNIDLAIDAGQRAANGARRQRQRIRDLTVCLSGGASASIWLSRRESPRARTSRFKNIIHGRSKIGLHSKGSGISYDLLACEGFAMPEHLAKAKMYRERARELRNIAQSAMDEKSQRTLRVIIEEYEEMARAEERKNARPGS